jgi:putative oxidoreductase
MAGAVAVHAPAGFFVTSGGFEYPAFLGYSAAAIGLAGPGCYSLDHVTDHRLDRPWVVGVAFATSAAVAACVIRRRNARLQAQAQRQTSAPEQGR